MTSPAPSFPTPLFAGPPVVVGHRGAPVSHPENTPASFAEAARVGATWVELDARLDADGEVVVHHDPVLADGRAIIDLSTAELSAAGVWTLADVLAGLPDDLGVDLEIKNFPGEPDHDESMHIVDGCTGIVAASAARPLLVSSFNPMVLLAAADRGMPLPLGLLTASIDLDGGIEAALDLGCAVLCPQDSTDGLDAAGIAAAHEAGLSLLVWTVDDLDQARALAEGGIDAICTNDPAAVRGVLDDRVRR